MYNSYGSLPISRVFKESIYKGVHLDENEIKYKIANKNDIRVFI